MRVGPGPGLQVSAYLAAQWKFRRWFSKQETVLLSVIVTCCLTRNLKRLHGFLLHDNSAANADLAATAVRTEKPLTKHTPVMVLLVQVTPPVPTQGIYISSKSIITAAGKYQLRLTVA